MIIKDGKRIIVSADDFGISRKANENILKLAEENKLDRVEVMISRNITKEQAERLIASKVKLDIHLHLAEDKLDYWQEHERKIETGAVKRGILFFYNIFFGKNRPKKVGREWEDQIEDFRKIFGRFPDGISSHEHIHFFPFYFRIAAEIYKKYRLSYIRFGKKYASEKSQISAIINLMKKMDRSIFEKYLLSSSDVMVSFDWIDDFNSFLKKSDSQDDIEVVFHPEKKNEYDFIKNIK